MGSGADSYSMNDASDVGEVVSASDTDGVGEVSGASDTDGMGEVSGAGRVTSAGDKTEVRTPLPRPTPEGVALEGRYARLEPLSPERHGAQLYSACAAPGADARFRYMAQEPPTPEAFRAWLEAASSTTDPRFFAVIERASGRCEGRQALMRIVPEHGVIEVGNVVWGPAIARTRVATEALYLMAGYVFDTLGYRRFEWKCDALNEPSRRAALRFGFRFEGVFRQHMVVKGKNRDTAWYALLDHEWAVLKHAYERWLRPENFSADGQQRERLSDLVREVEV